MQLEGAGARAGAVARREQPSTKRSAARPRRRGTVARPMQLPTRRRRRLAAIALALAALGCRAGGRGVENAPRPVHGGTARLLRVHPLNSRYFSDGSGKAVYLTGAHTWNNLQDVKAPIRGGFARYLDFLVAHHHNFIRFWMVEHAWDASDASFSASPLPWPRSSSQPARDGKPKFDPHAPQGSQDCGESTLEVAAERTHLPPRSRRARETRRPRAWRLKAEWTRSSRASRPRRGARDHRRRRSR